MRNPFLKFVMKDRKADIVHTSAYSRAQNGGSIGAASVRSFAERMQTEKNRKRVRGYNDSRIVTQAYGASGVRAKKYTPPEPAETTGAQKRPEKPGVSR